MARCLHGVSLNQDLDKIFWLADKSGIFPLKSATKSLHSNIAFLDDGISILIWKSFLFGPYLTVLPILWIRFKEGNLTLLYPPKSVTCVAVVEKSSAIGIVRNNSVSGSKTKPESFGQML